jgi:hypothetical protein
MIVSPQSSQYNQDERSEGMMGIFGKKSKEADSSKCAYCRRPFQTLAGGFYFGGAGNDIGETILHMRKGCDACGKPVCFNCAAEAADRRGQHGHCICPSCGANLDS